ncbi:MAG: 2-hydroxyhepta-2,4-diene-1,7-dioate isomerase [Alphaproteobacteria bacterium RIFOXYD12_FULL_60_8]|nr:MAG: 2-hydroxyhepta-2,4-diene-1,7-dioate isomerase [Alphaproteobacteria bacterium RIFOXYD12_FULL_60_8]
MKLLRHGPVGAERYGRLDEAGNIRDLFAHLPDIAPTVDNLARVTELDAKDLPLIAPGTRLGPPVTGIGNILCIGLNYRKHAEETNAKLPTEPLIFSKHTGALNGPFDPVRLPPGSTMMDWEVELAVVIGREASHIAQSHALEYVAGYLVCNDVSERHYQKDLGGQWIKGKSCPTFCPLGPYLVTPEEITDPQNLDLWLTVNGQTMQSANTSDMIFSVAEIIAYVSRFMALKPGDVISTGTPSGVGLGRRVFLKDGDVMELGVAGLGTQRQLVVAT